MENFETILSQMAEYEKRLNEIELNNISTLKKKAGVYVFYDGNEAKYVGKTDNLGNRLKQHSDIKSKNNQATFAFIMAKEKWSKNNKTDLKFTRKALEAMESFNSHFKETKIAISKMQIKYVEITNPYHQYLFEYWLAIKLEAKHNQFNNH